MYKQMTNCTKFIKNLCSCDIEEKLTEPCRQILVDEKSQPVVWQFSTRIHIKKFSTEIKTIEQLQIVSCLSILTAVLSIPVQMTRSSPKWFTCATCNCNIKPFWVSTYCHCHMYLSSDVINVSLYNFDSLSYIIIAIICWLHFFNYILCCHFYHLHHSTWWGDTTGRALDYRSHVWCPAILLLCSDPRQVIHTHASIHQAV